MEVWEKHLRVLKSDADKIRPYMGQRPQTEMEVLTLMLIESIAFSINQKRTDTVVKTILWWLFEPVDKVIERGNHTEPVESVEDFVAFLRSI